MKKLLNISVIAALAILPLAANADPMTAVTINTPQDTQTVATTGYVKGAYNELVAGKQDKLSEAQLQAIEDVTDLNTDVSALKTAVGDENSGLTKAVADNTSDISALETAVGDNTGGLVKDVADLKTTVGDSTSGLVKTVGDENSGLVKDVADLKTASGDYATKTGVVATVTAATATASNVNLTVSGTPTGRVESTLSGASVNIPTNATVPTLTTWGNDNSNSTATVTLNTTATTVNGTVTSTFTGTGIDSGTATGTVNSTVSVTGGTNGYHAN